MAEEFVKHNATCDHCDHGPMQHYCWWNKFIANPIKKFGTSSPKSLAAMSLLRNEILDRILLRRTKLQQADVLSLPPRTVMLRRDAFDEVRRCVGVYERLISSVPRHKEIKSVFSFLLFIDVKKNILSCHSDFLDYTFMAKRT
jgi:hypothetical protein